MRSPDQLGPLDGGAADRHRNRQQDHVGHPGTNEGDKPPYYQAAMYYLENNKDLKQGWKNGSEKRPQTKMMRFGSFAVGELPSQTGQKSGCEGKSRIPRTGPGCENDDYVKLNDKLLAQLAK